MLTRKLVTTAAVAAVVVAGAAYELGGSSSYHVSVLMADATNVVNGGPVLVDGFNAGAVDSIKVENGKALVSFHLDSKFAPLHDGAVVTVGWKAALSERNIQVTDGPATAATVPDGGTLHGLMPAPVEVDDILNALDPSTRSHLASTLKQLAATMHGSESNASATLQSAGPAIQALGQISQALGTDGPAIKDLVTRMNLMMGTLAQRDASVQTVVTQLTNLTQAVASKRAQLRTSLRELPGTLSALTSTMNKLPGVASQAVPLLQDLAPTTAKLGPFAKQLAPVLKDLRPLAAELRPGLAALQQLLGDTPSLVGNANTVLPTVGSVVQQAQSAVAFMRPYTPEMMGFFSTWASAYSNYDNSGNMARMNGIGSASSLNMNPGIVPPGITIDPHPQPGAVVGQTWTDAYGSAMR